MAQTFRKSKIEKFINRLEIRKQCSIEAHKECLEKSLTSPTYKELSEYYEGQVKMAETVITDLQEIFSIPKAQ